jgi:hypothetical protein
MFGDTRLSKEHKSGSGTFRVRSVCVSMEDETIPFQNELAKRLLARAAKMREAHEASDSFDDSADEPGLNEDQGGPPLSR